MITNLNTERQDNEEVNQETEKSPSTWHLKPINLRNSRLLAPILSLSAILLLFAISNIVDLSRYSLWQEIKLPFNSALFIIGLFFLFRIGILIRHELISPFIHLRNWAGRMNKKDYSARLPVTSEGEFSKLAMGINSLSDKFEKLSAEFQDQVALQTRKIEDKNHSLKILYSVATVINKSKDLDELLSRFLYVLIDLTKAKAGVVRLRTEDDQLKLVASVGLNKEFVLAEETVPIDRCMCGASFTKGVVKHQLSIEQCRKLSGKDLFAGTDTDFGDADTEMISVPLEHRNVHLGIYNLYIPGPARHINEDITDLLGSIGQHLGMAIEKFHLDEESYKHSIYKERTLLAHELHDSLAQTLASLRFQVTVIEENVLEKIPVDREEISRLHESIDEAYREVRALISHFRGPINHQGLIPALDKITRDFESNNNISVFFQNEWSIELTSEQEFQVVRVVQEALNNVRKHSKARTVRILARSHPNHLNEVLIEDDGVGIQENKLSGSAGEHIGLTVMQDRATRIGGKLSIESEPGEGTQILLQFPSQVIKEQEIKFFNPT